MKRINIEVCEDLKKEIKMQAAKEGISLRIFITRCIIAGLHASKNQLTTNFYKEKK